MVSLKQIIIELLLYFKFIFFTTTIELHYYNNL
jgi:hypothetical protein